MFSVEKVLNGKLLEYCYLAHDDKEKKCICIDPGYNTETIMKYIDDRNLVVDTILLTHSHFDHMLSCKSLQDKFGSKIYISKEDEKTLYDADNNYATLIHQYTFDKFNITANVHDGEHLNVLGYDIECISTPGHTFGGFSFYIESEKTLFSGDTLFKDTFGRIDLYGGSFEAIKNSIIHKLFLLPDDTIVYPGHGEMTSIGYEKENNEILRGE